jgi:mannose-1-phosphate guanylyltransferase
MMSNVRNAFVLGAGLGTRLRPITNVLPKPLLPIFGKPLITFVFDHLHQIGIEKIVINTHHLADRFSQAFPSREYRGLALKFVHEQIRLETGGGLKNVEPEIGHDPFIVYSGDLVTDIAIDRLVEEHFQTGNDVTLALRSTGLSTFASWDAQSNRVADLLDTFSKTGSAQYDFAGVSIWNPSVFSRIQAGATISFVPVIIEWMKAGGQIGGVVLEENRWFNIGDREQYLKVHRSILRDGWRPAYLNNDLWPVRIEPSAHVSATARVHGGSYVGAHCRVGEGAVIQDSILLPHSSVAAGAFLESCIVAGRDVSAGRHDRNDFV